MKVKMNKYFKLLLPYFLVADMNSCFASKLPRGFVYLREIEPTIIENLRYYSSENFIGRKLDGYEKNCVILSEGAAKALSNVQQDLLKDGYSLVVYDAYRPQKTVDLFIRWSKDFKDQSQKEKYYPNIDKKDLFKLGYIAEKSGHSRGSTIDLTIIKLNNSLKNVTLEKRKIKDGSIVTYLDDGTVDMGSSFDLFDIASHHDSKVIDPKYLKFRNYLRSVMEKNGFNGYQEEWWHYTLKEEPFTDTYFNFSVE